MVALAKSAPQTLHHIQFPNENAAYRRARNALLEQEMELRRQIERVAANAERCRPAEISKRTTSLKRQAKTVSRRG